MCATPSRLLSSALLVVLIACPLVAISLSVVALAQAAPIAGGNLPEAVYWKQDLFLVPYQWSSAAEPAAAQAVWLFVSKDRGASWQKISEARPHVKAFNYRAEGDGEYWFSVRTFDRYGREWPTGPHYPELRVIVDTQIPRIDELRCTPLADGTIQISWRCSDQNLDPSTWTLEAQVDAAGAWQPVPAGNRAEPIPIADVNAATGGVHSGQATWRPAMQSRPVAIRATVFDRAGNSGSYRCEIMAPPGSLSATHQSSTSSESAGSIFAAPPLSQSSPASIGWASASSQSAPANHPLANQPWPADAISRTPFRLSGVAPSAANDDVTVYGTPPSFIPNLADSAIADAEPGNNGIGARYAGPVVSAALEPAPADVANDRSAPTFTPLEPFRQASISRLPPPTAAETPVAPQPATELAAAVVPPVQPKLVGSRTFALEYDLHDAGLAGVSKVELWGTRDGGQTWRSFARDDDHRSPMVVTVDDEGVYGFRIVVECTGSVAALPPSPGDAPELWVAVDLHRPVVELTAIERGEGNQSDHLILHWTAVDDNLEPRPIALFYSSRPAGPWSAIATSLHNTGEYSWRVERHVPARFYLRAEARDVAGNLAAYQTREPIEFSPQAPGGRLLDANVGDPSAGDSFR
jgi:hypothetical protein